MPNDYTTFILYCIEHFYSLLLRDLTQFTLFIAFMVRMIWAIIPRTYLLKPGRMLSRMALMVMMRMVKGMLRALLAGIIVTSAILQSHVAPSTRMDLLLRMATVHIVSVVGASVGRWIVVRVSSLIIHSVLFDASIWTRIKGAWARCTWTEEIFITLS